MERNEAELRRSLQPGAKNHQLTILAQLLQIIERMEHIDDVFLWLANQMVPHLRIDALQIWTVQTTHANQVMQAVRAVSVHDNTIPQHVVMNSSIEETVAAIATKRKSIPALTVDDMFAFHHANLLKRYGLYYSTACFLSSNIPLSSPKIQNTSAPAKVPTIIVTLVFLKQPGSQQLVPTINLLLEQTLLIAESHGLLSTASVNESSPLMSTPAFSLPALYDLIPRRIQSNTSMRSSSPFSNTVSISSKIARTFYGAIDGKRTVVEIATTKKMSAQELTEAVRTLLQEKHVQLYTKAGQLVGSEVLLRSM